MASVSLSSSTRVKVDEGDTSKPKAGLFSKHGSVGAVHIALEEATSNPDLSDLFRAAVPNEPPLESVGDWGGFICRT